MAKIRNKKIAKIRVDPSNFDAPTLNRALDNIIDNLNPFIEQVSKTISSGDVGISAVTIQPSGAVAVVSDNFILSGSGGISFSSNPAQNTITIAQTPAPTPPSSSITFNVQGASQLTGSTFNLSGAGGISYTTPNSNTLVINSPTVQINTETGSVAGNSFNIYGAGCAIDTYVNGGNIYISSSAKPVTGGTNITVGPASSQIVQSPNTTFLWHCDGANLATASVNDGWATASVGYEAVPLVSQTPAHVYLSTTQAKFGPSSFYFDGNNAGLLPQPRALAEGNPNPAIGLYPAISGIAGLSGSYTFEFWLRPDMSGDPIATVRTVAHINQSTALNYGFLVVLVSGGGGNTGLYLSFSDGVGGPNSFTIPVNSITANTWQHVAISRQGTNIKVFVNGVMLFDGLSPSGYSPNQIQIGQYAGANNYTYKGYIDEIRFSNNVCLYTTSFSPPTAAFPNYFTTSSNTCVDEISLNNNISLTSVTASAGFSGFLYGTASYALAPTVDTGSFVTTSSFNAFTASYNTGSFSGSFIGTASYATNALTASYATNSLSSSFATNALTASLANTASYALDGVVGGDLSGSTANATVIRLQGRSVANHAPLDGESLVWSSTYSYWYPQMVSGSGGSGLVQLPTYHQTGSLASGSVQIQLPNGVTQFPITDLDYVIYTTTFQETSGSDWKNDIGSVALFLSASHIYAQIDAPAAPYAYNFNAINTNISSSANFSPPRYYGEFCDLTTQTASNTTTAYSMKFNTDNGSNGFSIISGSQITAQYSGTYNLQFSAQLSKASANDEDAYIWLRKNGVNVPRSATKVTLAGSDAAVVAAWDFIVNLNPNDYVEIMWNPKDTGIVLLYENSSSNPSIPEIPSVIATITGV